MCKSVVSLNLKSKYLSLFLNECNYQQEAYTISQRHLIFCVHDNLPLIIYLSICGFDKKKRAWHFLEWANERERLVYICTNERERLVYICTNERERLVYSCTNERERLVYSCTNERERLVYSCNCVDSVTLKLSIITYCDNL
jgi:hypothetical protein